MSNRRKLGMGKYAPGESGNKVSAAIPSTQSALSPSVQLGTGSLHRSFSSNDGFPSQKSQQRRGITSSYYEDDVDYTAPVAAATTRPRVEAWPKAGYAAPDGWMDRTLTVNERPYSPSRSGPLPSLSGLTHPGVTNPLLTAKRGYPSPVLSDVGCVYTRLDLHC